MSATHDSILKERAPHRLGTLRVAPTRPGSPRFHADEPASESSAGCAEHVALCALETSVPLALRQLRPLRTNAQKTRARDRTNVHPRRPAVTEVTSGRDPSAQAASPGSRERTGFRLPEASFTLASRASYGERPAVRAAALVELASSERWREKRELLQCQTDPGARPCVLRSSRRPAVIPRGRRR